MGITGANYFNSSGDPPLKSISVGVFRGRKIVSAPVQLQNVHQLTAVDDLDTAVKDGRIIMFDKSPMRKVNMVYTGVDIKKVSELDSDDLTYKLDFLLWFRYSGNFSPQDVQFTNAVEPIKLGDPLDVIVDTSGIYQRYHVVGYFKTELSPDYYIFNKRVLSMSLRHKELTRDQLIYVVDVLGMPDEKILTHQLKNAQVLSLTSGWLLNNIRFTQTTVLESTLGKPNYLNVNNVGYSNFMMDIVIQKNEFSPRTLVDSDKVRNIAKTVLVMNIIILLFLSLLNHFTYFSFPKTVLLLQAITIYLILRTGETVFLNQIAYYSGIYYLQIVTIVTLLFDILRWIVSAILLHLAIERFLWIPLEKSARRKIPNIIRNISAFIIYILVLFGIIAFVFDQALTSLLATSGVIVMIIGLAIQINISNIFSGIALNIENPFRVGDWVKIGETIDAKVINMTWRTTVVKLRNNAVLSIPNSTVAESEILNYSYPDPVQEMAIQVNIDPSHDPELVEKILIDAALSCQSILRKPLPYVLYKGVDEWSASYRLIVCSSNYARWSRIYKEVWGRVWVHLNRAGIEFAIKQQKIHIFKGLAERGEEATHSVTLLQEIDIFHPFSIEDKQQLSQQMTVQKFFAGDVVVEQGQQGDSLFIIIEGAVNVQVETDNYQSTIEVARLGAGNFFGEMALLTGAERAATVTAITDTRVYEITKANLMPLLQKRTEASMLISKILTNRQTATQLQINDKPPSEKEKQSIYEQFLYRIENFFGLNKE
jgi:branched-chain amino acid transport system substrate-binding protein